MREPVETTPATLVEPVETRSTADSPPGWPGWPSQSRTVRCLDTGSRWSIPGLIGSRLSGLDGRGGALGRRLYQCTSSRWRSRRRWVAPAVRRAPGV